MDTSADAPAHEPITLTRFILDQEHKHPEATGDLTLLMNAIQTACKVIASAVRKAGIAGLYGMEVGAGDPHAGGQLLLFLWCVAVLGWSPGPTTPLVPRCH
jgi:fructose-1,6-bisphosphatase I